MTVAAKSTMAGGSVALVIRHVIARITSINILSNMDYLFQPKVLFGWENVRSRSSSTSWLDGLRGVAALQVFFFHFFGRHTPWGRTYGSSEDDMYLHQLPIFRGIWGAGSGAVSTFFVISGCAITFKSFRLLREKKFDDLYSGLCSSLIRRGFRLYLPVLLLAVPTFFLVRMIDLTDGFVYPGEVTETFEQQFRHFVNFTDHHVNPFAYKDQFNTGSRYTYVPTSWTIPMEYYGSIVCYIMVMIVSGISMFRTRLAVVGFMAVYAIHRGSWWTSNFLIGMILADWMLDQSTSKSTTRAKIDSETHPTRKKLRTVGFVVMFLIGFYLGGMPPHIIQYDFNPKPKPGYEFLYKIFPPSHLIQLPEDSRWYWYWCGNFTVISISQLPRLRAIFDTKFCQWLGKLSFAFYLIHALVISAMSRPLQAIIKQFTEHKGVICFVEFAVEMPFIFILSTLIERYIDRPSVQFAKWFEEQLRKDGGEVTLEDAEIPLVTQAIQRLS